MGILTRSTSLVDGLGSQIQTQSPPAITQKNMFQSHLVTFQSHPLIMLSSMNLSTRTVS